MDLFLCLSLFGFRYQKYHSLVACKQQTLILTVLESGEFKIKIPQIQHLMRAQFFIHKWPSFHCNLTWWQSGWESFWGPPHTINYHKFQHMNGGRAHINIQILSLHLITYYYFLPETVFDFCESGLILFIILWSFLVISDLFLSPFLLFLLKCWSPLRLCLRPLFICCQIPNLHLYHWHEN